MGKIIVVCGICILQLLWALLVVPVAAHAPSEMQVEYDTDAHMLTVTIVHNVSDPATHYIYKITIENGGTYEYEYESQPTDSQFTYTYTVDAASGEVITVTAECILGGFITGELEIGTHEHVEPRRLWPVHAILMSTGLLLVLVAVTNVIKKEPKRWWLTAHKAVGTASVVFIICGLAVAYYMVSLYGGDHFSVFHAYLGLVTLSVTLVTPIVGYVSLNWRPRRKPVRTAHVWLSRAAVVLLLLTILSGMVQAGILV